ncbi:MAG: hypothetical protein ACUVV6_02905 [Thermoplasmatota archaeon]
MRLSRDKSGRVTYSLVAVFILTCSIPTGVYIQRFALESRGGLEGWRPADAEACFCALRDGIEAVAIGCIKDAVREQMEAGARDGHQALWRVEESFLRLFGRELRALNGSHGNLPGRPTVEAVLVSVSLAPALRTILTLNRFGMEVEMPSPAALRASCVVNLTLEFSGDQKVSRDVDVVAEVDSWYPYMLSQAARMRRDCSPEGLVELMVREMVGGYLSRLLPDLRFNVSLKSSLKNHNFTAVLRSALESAVLFEEMVMFGTAPMSHSLLPSYCNLSSHLVSTPTYPGAPPDWKGEGLCLRLGDFRNRVYPYPPEGETAQEGEFALRSESSWLSEPEVSVKLLSFAGEEEYVDPYVLEVFVNGEWGLKIAPLERYQPLEVSVPVHLDFHIAFEERLNDSEPYVSGRLHCQIESFNSFKSEYGGLYSTPSTVLLDVASERAISLSRLRGGFLLELSVDGEPAGVFGPEDVGPNGLELSRVPSGPHQFDALLTFPDGTAPMFGSETADVWEWCRVMVQTSSSVESLGLWKVLFEYLRDTPRELRLAKAFELFSRLSGLPPPPNWQSLGGCSVESVGGLIGWGMALDSHMSAGGAAAASAAIGAAQATRIQGFVRVSLEVLRRVELAVGSLKLDAAGRVEAFKLARVAFELSYDTSGRAQGLKVTFESNLVQASLRFDKVGGKWSLVETEAGKSWEGARPHESLKQPAVGALGDLIGILATALSIYTKDARLRAGGDGGSFESLDLSLEYVKLGLRIGQLVARLGTAAARTIAGAAAARFALAIVSEVASIITAAIMVSQCILSEIDKFRGDSVWVEDLLMDIDASTITFYLALAGLTISLVGLASFMLGAATIAAACGPAAAIVLAVSLLVYVIFNWDAVYSAVTGEASGEARGRITASVTRTLRETMEVAASLNRSASIASQSAARTARGAALAFDRLGLLSTNATLCFELQNLSVRTMDEAWGRQHQAVAVRALKYFTVTLWRQVDDCHDEGTENSQMTEFGDRNPFKDEGNIGNDFTWDGDIFVTDPSLGWVNHHLIQTKIEEWLTGLTPERARNATASFRITGSVCTDGLDQWANSLARIGDQMTKWQKRLDVAQAMSLYTSGLDGVAYSHDWGYLRFRAPSSILLAEVSLKTLDKREFTYLDSSLAPRKSSLLDLDISNPSESRGVYLEPGKYVVKCRRIDPELELKKREMVVEVSPLYSSNFSTQSAELSLKAAPVYFTIKNGASGNIMLSIDTRDREGRVWGSLYSNETFNETTSPEGKIYITDSWVSSLALVSAPLPSTMVYPLVINFTVGFDPDLDGNFTDWCSREVSLGAIRESHVALMKRQDRKADDQLGYCLEILDHPDSEGRRIVWRQVTF